MEGQVSEAWSSASGIPSAWHVYFPEEEYVEDSPRGFLFRDLLDFLSTPKGRVLLSEAVLNDTSYYLPLDFRALQQSSIADDFSEALQDEPNDAISCFGVATCEILFHDEKNEFEPGKINIRLYNYEQSLLALRNLKAAFVGRLVSIRGSVVRMSMVKPLVTRLDFTCAKCGTRIDRKFVDGKYSPPAKCISDGCRSKAFTPDRRSASMIDFQKLRVQEILSAAGQEEGRMPRTVEVELTEDLVDTCIPGDVVTVCGFVKVTDVPADGKGKARKDDSLFVLYLDAISIISSKNERASMENLDVRAGAPPNAQKFTPRDLEFVVRFASENGVHLFRRLLHSICPSIYGHETVKAAILLSLFGGVQKHVMDDDRVPVRGDIHVLIVGDPGLGKSQLLKAVTAVAPRGIYVCGNGVTSAGLTATVVKDTLSGDYVFEAGAMVLADRGVCCIDEFDKMTADYQALLEGMEQQSVSIAKAGLVANLAARTSVIAAANPVDGHYNRAKTVNENLKMSAALLSRFDLLFILLDKPNELLDQQLSEHVMARHGGSEGQMNAAWKSFKDEGGVVSEKQVPLRKRLQLDKTLDSDFSPLPGPLLRKYIAYAKQYVFPRLSDAAAAVLQEFYLKLRSEKIETPITARQLESLIRLAEARAKLELREEVSEQDAQDVVEIMKESLFDKFLDEHGHVDFSRSGGMSQAKEVKRFVAALQKRSEHEKKTTFSLAELYVLADDIDVHVPDLDIFIEKLNDAGYLLKKGSKMYQITK